MTCSLCLVGSGAQLARSRKQFGFREDEDFSLSVGAANFWWHFAEALPQVAEVHEPRQFIFGQSNIISNVFQNTADGHRHTPCITLLYLKPESGVIGIE